MYCKNCNAYNDDNSRFCSSCGTELDPVNQQANQEQNVQPENGGYAPSEPQPQPQYSQQYSQQYAQQYDAPPYSQPQYSAPAEKPFSNTMAIISIVINVVVFNFIGLIFAILSLTNYNSYEDALRAGNIALAEQLKAKSQKYSKVAIIICIVIAAISAIVGIIAFISVFIFAADQGFSSFEPDVFDEFEIFSETVSPTIAQYFS